MSSGPSPNKKRKTVLTSVSSGSSTVVLHGVECPLNIYLCYFSSCLPSHEEQAYYIRPLQMAFNIWNDDRDAPLYPDHNERRSFGEIFRVDNVYYRSAHRSHFEFRCQSSHSSFRWPCFVWTRPDDSEDRDTTWTLLDWLKNFRTEFHSFVSWTTNNPVTYDKWNYASTTIAIKFDDMTRRGHHSLSNELVDADVIHVICNTHADVKTKEDLLQNEELLIRYFGSANSNVRDRIQIIYFPFQAEE